VAAQRARGLRHNGAEKVKRSKLNARAIVLLLGGFTLLPFSLSARAPHQLEGTLWSRKKSVRNAPHISDARELSTSHL
jgi:hypothetical protein